jgi:hypothetical protein
MIIHKKPYSLVIIVSAIMQVAAYVLRVLSIQNPANALLYSLWFILMMVRSCLLLPPSLQFLTRF